MDLLSAARWVDVVIVIAAAPFVVLMELPVLGYVAGAAGWTLSRLLGWAIERRAVASGNARTFAGLTMFSSLGRAWLMGLTILVVGLAGARKDGLTAAVLVLVAFTLYLVIRIALRPLERSTSNT
ncbi:MAG TPA: hypothetical protein VF533_19505 [Solirubrobacteraceae bacterium]